MNCVCALGLSADADEKVLYPSRQTTTTWRQAPDLLIGFFRKYFPKYQPERNFIF
jgi:hypothetical protein